MSNKCEICNINDHKYKCPRCNIQTCSLQCCKQHKSNTGCDGQRDKTKFVNKTEFDEQVLLSDYKFLEEQARVIDLHQRGVYDKTNETTISTTNSMQENLRKFVHNQFKINLKLMPYQSTRHLNNKTRFNRSANTVSWSLEIVFHLNTNELFRFNTKTQLYSSGDTLKSILAQFYKDFKSELFENYKAKEIKYKNLYETFNHIFDKDDMDDLNILFEIIDINLKQKYFIKFDCQQKMEKLLFRKTFIEYPTLFLVRSQNLDKYLIKNSFEEREENSNPMDIIESIEKIGSKLETISTINNQSSRLSIEEKNEFKRTNLEDLEDGECDDSDEDINIEKTEFKDSKRTLNIDCPDLNLKKLKS